MKKQTQIDIHQVVTDAIVAAIEAGAGEWKMPWHTRGGASFIPTNVEGHRYRGINCVHLWAVAERRNYASGALWGTFKQWLAKGAQVRKGEKGTLIVFYKQFDVTPDPDREDDDGKRAVLRHSWAFAEDQVDGFQPPEQPPPMPPIEKLAHVEAVLAATGAKVIVGGDRAYYPDQRPHPAARRAPLHRRCQRTPRGHVRHSMS